MCLILKRLICDNISLIIYTFGDHFYCNNNTLQFIAEGWAHGDITEEHEQSDRLETSSQVGVDLFETEKKWCKHSSHFIMDVIKVTGYHNPRWCIVILWFWKHSSHT